MPDRLLIADDAPDQRFYISAILQQAGYAVTLAATGQEALTAILAEPPALAILDVQMPDLTGYAITRTLRQQSDLPFLPICLITGFDTESVVEGLDAGADDFLRKPIAAAELLARVRALLRLRQSLEQQQRMLAQREDFLYRLSHDLRTGSRAF